LAYKPRIAKSKQKTSCRKIGWDIKKMNIKTILKWFVPHKDNQYQPYALRKKAFTFYVAAIFVLKASVGFLFLAFPETAHLSQVSIKEIVDLANQSRAEVGLPSLTLNAKLNISAAAKAEDMMTKQYFAHTSPEGIEPWFWFEKAGYNYTYAGENLALGFETSEGVHQAWMNSKGHRDNIINPNYKDIGVAIVYGNFEGSFTTIIVQHFGSIESTVPKEIPAYPPQKETTPTKTTPSTPPPSSDHTAPLPPSILTPASRSLTNDKEIIITGQAEAGSTILIYEQNQKIGQTKANKNNHFNFASASDFSDGEHSFRAMAIDSAGNRSAFSKSVAVIIDTVPPVIDLERSYILPTYLAPLETFDVFTYVTGEPIEVRAISDQTEVILQRKEEHLYSGVIHQSATGVWVMAKDAAGNTTKAKLNFTQNSSSERDLHIIDSNNSWGLFLNTIDQMSRSLIIIFTAAIAILLLVNIMVHIKKQNTKTIGTALLIILMNSLLLTV